MVTVHHSPLTPALCRAFAARAAMEKRFLDPVDREQCRCFAEWFERYGETLVDRDAEPD
jgi:hypothetical protein